MALLSIALKIALVAAIPFSLAAPAENPNGQNIQITIEKSLKTSETELSVTNQAGANTLASSCSNHLNLPGLNTSVAANVDDSGSGTLKIGNVVYKIHENIDISGGISCNRMYSDEEVFVTCDLPSTDIRFSEPLTLLRRSVATQQNCFATRKRSMPASRSLKDHAMVMLNGAAGGTEPRAAISNDDITVARSMGKRQGACGSWVSTTTPVEDPDPHQNYYLKQLSENQLCGSQSCSVGETETFSISVGFSVSSGSKANGFVSAGFDVSASWSHSENHGCNGDPGDTICVWYNTAHTAYTVKNVLVNPTCGGSLNSGDPFVMFSPNTNNVGGSFYCVAGTACRSVNSAYWDYNGPAGGP